jgi:dipeptidyl aminopeptidase/acylaminoacyl peptidase
MTDGTLSIEDIARAYRLSDVAWNDNGRSLVWLEGRSSRNVLVSRSRENGCLRDLTRDWAIRARVGYGGADFSVRKGVIYFVDGRRLFRQNLRSFSPELILETEHPITAPTVSPDGKQLVLIESTQDRDRLLLIPTNGEPRAVELFHETDFCMQPAWNPSSDRLSWVVWDHPWMPWQESRTLVADLEFEPSPRLLGLRELLPEGSGSAAFQPAFSPDGRWLSCVSDRNGWFNLELFDAEKLTAVGGWDDAAEHAPPAWLQGMRSYGWRPDSEGIWLLRSCRGLTRLFECNLESRGKRRVQGQIEEYTHLFQPAVHPTDGSLAVIASSPSQPTCILECTPRGSVSIFRRSVPDIVTPAALGAPEAVECAPDGVACHGLLWSPADSRSMPKKAVIRVHGGPQSQASAEFDYDIQFYTSHGYRVFDLNYRGSSGYGKAYRRSLEGRWGDADVEDLAKAADYLVRTQGIDPARIVLSGGSAGGFTILVALARYPGRFRAAVCRYAVTDLFALTRDMPKFERSYLDTLIGPLHDCQETYRERSPLNLADRITDPVALFQGEEDRVVPPAQARCLAQSLRERGVPCRLHLFPGEGHGWRQTETIRQYYSLVTEFLAEHVPGS